MYFILFVRFTLYRTIRTKFQNLSALPKILLRFVSAKL